MKQLTLLLFALLTLAACQQQAKGDSNDGELEYELVSYASPDSSSIVITLEAPTEYGTTLADSLKSYFGAMLGSDFLKALEDNDDDNEKAVKSFGKSMYEDMKNSIEALKADYENEGDELPEYALAWEHQVAIHKEAETDRFVTYLYEKYEYMGGAHGLSTCYGTTFDKETGKDIDLSILKDTASVAFQTMFKEKLLKYFTDNEDESLGDYLLYQSPDENISLSNMYLTEDKVVFIYQPYEISFYAAGMPTVELSFDEIKPFLTKRGISLIKDDKEDE